MSCNVPLRPGNISACAESSRARGKLCALLCFSRCSGVCAFPSPAYLTSGVCFEFNCNLSKASFQFQAEVSGLQFLLVLTLLLNHVAWGVRVGSAAEICAQGRVPGTEGKLSAEWVQGAVEHSQDKQKFQLMSLSVSCNLPFGLRCLVSLAQFSENTDVPHENLFEGGGWRQGQVLSPVRVLPWFCPCCLSM